MAKSKRLKVFRTPIGFHDAYVAAPSQKAALEAWGADVNLFARGTAEEVTDPELTKEPLANPGVVFKRLRGSEKEQIAALGRDEAKRGRARPSPPHGFTAGPSLSRTEERGRKKSKPSRAELSDAEEALKALEKAQRTDQRALDKREQELAQERRELERRQQRDRRKAETALQEARKRYERAVEEW